VIREPVYGMLLVRCPECSTPASLQEYPLLGRWASRWAALAAALWLAVLVAMLFASAGILLGLANEVAAVASQPAVTFLEKSQREWFNSLDAQGQSAVASWVSTSLKQNAAYNIGWLDQSWWAGLDRAAILAKAGGWRSATNWGSLSDWPFDLFFAAVIGAVWSVALLAQKRRRVGVLVLAIVAVAAALQYLIKESNPWMIGAVSTTEAAYELVGWRVFALTLLISPLGLWVGVLLGRPLIRMLARALLPPRMQGSLAFLWIADGLPPPRPRPAPRL
jgi:hypothetical protein